MWKADIMLDEKTIEFSHGLSISNDGTQATPWVMSTKEEDASKKKIYTFKEVLETKPIRTNATGVQKGQISINRNMYQSSGSTFIVFYRSDSSVQKTREQEWKVTGSILSSYAIDIQLDEVSEYIQLRIEILSNAATPQFAASTANVASSQLFGSPDRKTSINLPYSHVSTDEFGYETYQSEAFTPNEIDARLVGIPTDYGANIISSYKIAAVSFYDTYYRFPSSNVPTYYGSNYNVQKRINQGNSIFVGISPTHKAYQNLSELSFIIIGDFSGRSKNIATLVGYDKNNKRITEEYNATLIYGNVIEFNFEMMSEDFKKAHSYLLKMNITVDHTYASFDYKESQSHLNTRHYLYNETKGKYVNGKSPNPYSDHPKLYVGQSNPMNGFSRTSARYAKTSKKYQFKKTQDYAFLGKNVIVGEIDFDEIKGYLLSRE